MKVLFTSLMFLTLFTACQEPGAVLTKTADSNDSSSFVADCYNDLYIVEASEQASKVLFANGACKNGSDRHSAWQTVRIMAIQSEVYVNDAFSSVDRSDAQKMSVRVKNGKAYVGDRVIGSIEKVEGRYPIVKPYSGVCVSLAINDDPYSLESNSRDYPSESKHIFVHFSAQCR